MSIKPFSLGSIDMLKDPDAANEKLEQWLEATMPEYLNSPEHKKLSKANQKTSGEDAQCHSKITPWLPKSQYKMSMFWPEPEKQKAHWIGASAATWGMHKHPLGKDDAMYLVWQYRDCCQTTVSP